MHAPRVAGGALSGVRCSPDRTHGRRASDERTHLAGHGDGHRIVLRQLRASSGQRDTRCDRGVGQLTRARKDQARIRSDLHEQVPDGPLPIYQRGFYRARESSSDARCGRGPIPCRRNRRNHTRAGAGRTLRNDHRNGRQKRARWHVKCRRER